MMTSHPTFGALALLVLASSCAEPVGVDSNAVGKSGGSSSRGGGTSTSTTASGGTTETTTTTESSGTSGATTTTTATTNGGTAGTTNTASGGTTTTTTTASGGTTTAPVDCGTTSNELVLTNTPKTGSIGAATVVTVPTGATVPVSGLAIKFCFAVLGTSLVTVSPSAITLDSASINTAVAPYYLSITTSMKVTTEATTDGGACVVFNVGSVSGTESTNLTGTDRVTVDWRFSYSGLDTTKPGQVIVTLADAAAACSSMTF